MDIVIAFCAGIGIGWLLHESDKLLVLRRAQITRHEYRPPMAVLPLDHAEKWRRWTRRYIVFAEMLAHERGKPEIQLPSRADYELVTGLSWRHFWPYLKALRDAGAVELRGRAGCYWLVDKPTRRVLTRAAPYPSTPPPHFDFHTLSGTGGTVP